MALNLGRLIQTGLKNPRDFFRLIASLPKFVRLYWRLFQDRRVGIYLKFILLVALAYVISPIDLIPDWIVPILGGIDDLVVFIAASRYFIKHCPPEVVQEHVERIEHGF
jgi:uncharacterized membrane protein YkvA (DUF1232 family)